MIYRTPFRTLYRTRLFLSVAATVLNGINSSMVAPIETVSDRRGVNGGVGVAFE